MNLKIDFNTEEQNLLAEAGVIVEDKEYTKEDLSLCESQIMDYIMNQSKNDIAETQKKYNRILGHIFV